MYFRFFLAQMLSEIDSRINITILNVICCYNILDGHMVLIFCGNGLRDVLRKSNFSKFSCKGGLPSSPLKPPGKVVAVLSYT